MTAMAALTDKLSVKTDRQADTAQERPCVRVCKADGTETGLAFHGVPGGHEFTSFVLGLYNAAGPGQALDPETKEEIQAISQPFLHNVSRTGHCGSKNRLFTPSGDC